MEVLKLVEMSGLGTIDGLRELGQPLSHCNMRTKLITASFEYAIWLKHGQIDPGMLAYNYSNVYSV